MDHKARLLVLSLSVSVRIASAAPARYMVTDLGDLGGPIAARAVSGNGRIVGSGILTNGAYRGVVWQSETPLALDPAPGFTQSEAADIDDNGRVVLLSYSLGRIEPRAILVDGGSVTDLGAFVPRAMDPNGRVLGAMSLTMPDGTSTEQACLWEEGVLTTLMPFQGSEWSAASDADVSGRVVGWATPAGALRPKAVIWVDGISHDLGTLGGAMAEANAINATGLVVGVSTNADNEPHAFAFQLAGDSSVLSRTDLGWLSGHQSTAHAVNNGGAIVGTSNARAFLFENGAMIDLNTRIDPASGWNLVGAAGINDTGQIVGWGTHNGTHRSAFLLTPSCQADFTADGILNFFDVSLFLTYYNASNPLADLAAPLGTFNFFDVSAFLAAYSAGCP
jgi:probable HAF family extracellular repeat protein